MPPEQLPGHSSPLRPPADVYALGCVLFELLTGRAFYHQQKVARLGVLRPGLPPGVGKLIARLLDPEPDQRPLDGAETAGLLARLAEAEEKRRQTAESKRRREAESRVRIDNEPLAARRDLLAEEQHRAAAVQAEKDADVTALEQACLEEVRRQLVTDLAKHVAKAQAAELARLTGVRRQLVIVLSRHAAQVQTAEQARLQEERRQAGAAQANKEAAVREQARQAAEAKAKQEADARAREQARLAAEAKAKQEADARARERARLAAEAKVKKAAESPPVQAAPPKSAPALTQTKVLQPAAGGPAVLPAGPFGPNGKYRIERLLGQGSQGQVYLATHLPLNAPRALRILRRVNSGLTSNEFSRARACFELEASPHHPITSPHILRVDDFWEQTDLLALVMEYALGGSLADRIRRSRELNQSIPVEQALGWTRQAALGLAELHKRDIVHRDVKPSNILLDAQAQARLADLGLAQDSFSAFTTQPLHPGTPAYMPPEQCAPNTLPVHPAADVYALGGVLFELLTGQVYYRQKIGTRPGALRPGLPKTLDGLVAQMLDPDYRRRPRDGGETAGLIQGLLAVATESQPETKKGLLGRLFSRVSGMVSDDGSVGILPPPPPPIKELKVNLASGVEMILLRVPAGEFLFGEKKWTVYLDEYWIGKYPVTNAQFRAFLKASKYSNPEKLPAGKEDHPVVNVSWNDAAAFCAWAARVSRQPVRLPSEAEWEKAARGIDGRPYPWGNQEPDQKRCNFNHLFNGTTPVGYFSPQGDSPYDCVDMAGNIWEWVADWYAEAYLNQIPGPNPRGPSGGKVRILRGGSWLDAARNSQVSFRLGGNPANRDNYVGFRCSR